MVDKNISKELALGKSDYGSGPKTKPVILEKVETRDYPNEIHGGLFIETVRIKPMYTRDGILGYSQIPFKYELNIEKYNVLVKLLKERKAATPKFHKLLAHLDKQKDSAKKQTHIQ